MLWRAGDIEKSRGWFGPFLEKHDLKFHHAGTLASISRKTSLDIAAFDPERLEETTGTNVWELWPHFYFQLI
jgi:hypothetical protein